MLTNQEIFNRVARHLLAQNEKSIDDASDSCVYRSPDGLMCAVGCLIPNEHYDPQFEGIAVGRALSTDTDRADDRLLLVAALKAGGVDLRVSQDLLRELQQAHDNGNVEDWLEDLHAVARHFKLDASVLA